MKISPPRARPWNHMRDATIVGQSQNAFDGSATIVLKVSDTERVWLELDYAQLRDMAEWLLKCAERRPMVRE